MSGSGPEHDLTEYYELESQWAGRVSSGGLYSYVGRNPGDRTGIVAGLVNPMATHLAREGNCTPFLTRLNILRSEVNVTDERSLKTAKPKN